MKAIIPAIDISQGRCVRLTKGDFSTKKVYNQDPVELAKKYVSWGAKRIHIVDLDAAFGKGNNRALIHEICDACSEECIIEVGGGIRNTHDVKTLLAMGVDRLCLGTVLSEQMFDVIHWINKFGNIFVGSIDVKNNQVFISGWQKDNGVQLQDFIQQIKKVTLRSLQYTNINNDGTLNGADIKTAEYISSISHIPVIVSGGISSKEEIQSIMNNKDDNIVGIIVGKAIYENIIDIEEILDMYPSPDCSQW